MQSRIGPRSVGMAYLAAAATTIVLVAGLALYAAVQGRKQYDQLASHYSRNTASAFERHVSDAIKRTDLALLSIAEAYRDEAGEGAITQARFELLVGGLLRAQPELQSLRITDARGVAYIGPDVPGRGFDMAGSENFVRLRDGASGLVISRPYLGPLTQKWGIALSRPLTAADGSFAGMAVAILSTETFKDVLSAPDLGPHGYAHLHGADESIVFRYPAPAGVDPLVGTIRSSPEVRGGILAQQRDMTFFSDQFDGRRRATTMRQVGAYPLFVDVAVDPRDFMAGWRLSLLVLVATVLVVALVVSYAAVRLYRSAKRVAESEAHWRETAESLQLAVRAGNFGIYERDLTTGVLTASATAKEIWGLPPGSPMTFDTLLSKMPDEDRERMSTVVAEAISGHAQWNADYRVVWPDGSVHWINSVGRAYYTADGQPERVRGVVQDITARKAAEQSLLESYQALRDRTREVRLLNAQLGRRAMDAETAVRAKDAFLRNVSHELRTPLNHIIGSAQLMAMEPHDPAQDRWLRMLQDSSADLLVRVNQILDAARLEAGNLRLERVEFSPATVIEEIRLLYAQRAADKGIELVVALDPDLPATVIGDPQRIAQALMNYLDNALKFTERGTVTIVVRPLPAEPQHAVLRFEVADTGAGVGEDVEPTLFQPFVHGDSSLARVHGGLGVGLSTTRELARLMGGEVGLDSAPGQGSLFWFTARFDAVPAHANGADATGIHPQLPPPGAVDAGVAADPVRTV